MTTALPPVTMFTDGACSGNPGPGGYGTILRAEKKEKEFSKGFRKTTNNRMELMAVIAGLEALNRPCKVLIYADSQYVINSIEKGWVYKWKKNNWKKADKKRAENVDLWERLILQLEKHEIEFQWVRGHDGHIENERCDELAVAASHGDEMETDTGYESTH